MLFLEVWYRVFQSRHMTPPQVQQGWDQQNDNKVGLQEEKVVDPSSGGHIDDEQQEVGLKAWGKEGGHDNKEPEAHSGLREATETLSSRLPTARRKKVGDPWTTL